MTEGDQIAPPEATHRSAAARRARTSAVSGSVGAVSAAHPAAASAAVEILRAGQRCRSGGRQPHAPVAAAGTPAAAHHQQRQLRRLRGAPLSQRRLRGRTPPLHGRRRASAGHPLARADVDLIAGGKHTQQARSGTAGNAMAGRPMGRWFFCSLRSEGVTKPFRNTIGSVQTRAKRHPVPRPPKQQPRPAS